GARSAQVGRPRRNATATGTGIATGTGAARHARQKPTRYVVFAHTSVATTLAPIPVTASNAGAGALARMPPSTATRSSMFIAGSMRAIEYAISAGGGRAGDSQR